MNMDSEIKRLVDAYASAQASAWEGGSEARAQEARAALDTHLSALLAERDGLAIDLADARAQLEKVRRDRDTMIAVHDEVEAERDALAKELATHDGCDMNAAMVGVIRGITDAAGKNAVPFLDDAVGLIVEERDGLTKEVERLKTESARRLQALKAAHDADMIQCECGAAKADLPEGLCTCVAGEVCRILDGAK